MVGEYLITEELIEEELGDIVLMDDLKIFDNNYDYDRQFDFGGLPSLKKRNASKTEVVTASTSLQNTINSKSKKNLNLEQSPS
jgi:hypothetical protein